MTPEEKRQETIQLYEAVFKPAIETVKPHLPAHPIVLDVGCGSAVMSVEMAKDLAVSKMHLVDRMPEFYGDPLPPELEYHSIDVNNTYSLAQFDNRINLVTCFQTLHEFGHPGKAALNIFSPLPRLGIGLLIDFTEKGWALQPALSINAGEAAMAHYLEDLKNLRRTGLHSDHAIKAFWEQGMFPRLPGVARLVMQEYHYAVLYQAFPWGEVRPMPDELKRLVEQVEAEKQRLH